jgi:hypothetical protein
MTKIGLGWIILAFSLSFSGSAPLSVLHAQGAPGNDLSACHRPVRIFPVGHTTAHSTRHYARRRTPIKKVLPVSRRF